MLHPLEKEMALRVMNNILEACLDNTCLSPEAYRWIHLKAGFIAHYDLGGFMDQ